MTKHLLSRRIAILAASAFLGAFLLATPGCGNEIGEDQKHAGDEEGHAEEHGGEVHLDAEQIAAAGITTVIVGPARIEETLHLVARVASNQDTSVHVTPRVEGIVEVIHKGLGEFVKSGDTLADIWSVELGSLISDYLKALSTVEAGEETYAKTQELFQQRLAATLRMLDGEIAVAQRILERENELQEKSISTLRPYLQADKAHQSALLTKERELTTLTAERDTRLLEIEVDLRQARIDATAARIKLQVLGITEPEIAELPDVKGRYGRMIIRAPRDGVIMQRHITLNEHVNPQSVLFEIHDLSTVWILAAAYEKDLTQVRLGQKALVKLDALPGTAIEGKVSMVDYKIDANTRSAAVRVVLSNDSVEGWEEEFPLRPGMFGHIELVVSSRVGRVVVPEKAVVHEGSENFVFVAEEDEEGAFVRKAVEIRLGADGLMEIVKGVDPGERVVVNGTFTLKSIARQAELGGGHSH